MSECVMKSLSECAWYTSRKLIGSFFLGTHHFGCPIESQYKAFYLTRFRRLNFVHCRTSILLGSAGPDLTLDLEGERLDHPR